MASTAPKYDSTMDSIYERATEAGDQFAAAARKVGHAYLDSYEKTVDGRSASSSSSPTPASRSGSRASSRPRPSSPVSSPTPTRAP